MPNEPRWLTAAEVVDLNKLVVADTGEPFFLRSEDQLEGALGRLQNRYHYDGRDDVVDLAVLPMLAIAQAHAFEQGNKRTGFEAAVIFLEMNGYALGIEDDEFWADLFVAVLLHEFSEAAFVELIRKHVAPLLGS